MQDIIRLLPESLANQIAAGEVVQRPSSVVKELLENAIDAKATQIHLIVKDAGKTLIQIIDNGKGMSETDARMSFERHATSKISSSDDLFAIRTFGFRGEALASIAAVAQVELKTRTEKQETGTLIEIEGSKIEKQEAVATPKGTSIAVKNLFFNVPARRKFLKSDAVEFKHVLEEFQRVALTNPQVSMSLHHNDQEIYNLRNGKPAKRIIGLFGKSYQEQLIPCQEDLEVIKVEGYIGKPESSKRTKGEQFFFVNGRYIRHASLHHAVMNAFEGLLPDGNYPFYKLSIEIDPKDVDVNVHPTKTEVKFSDERTVYAVVSAAVKQALASYGIAPSIDFGIDVNFAKDNQPHMPTSFENTSEPTETTTAFSKFSDLGAEPPHVDFGADLDFSTTEDKPAVTKISSRMNDWKDENSTPPPVMKPWNNNTSSGIDPFNDVDLNIPSENEESQATELRFSSAANTETSSDEINESEKREPIQIRDSYILFQVKSGFMLMDQEAAHERVLYERFMQQINNNSGVSQKLLFPRTLELNPVDLALLAEFRHEIEALGFSIEVAGKTKVIISGMPVAIKDSSEKETLEGIIEQLKLNKSELELSNTQNIARSLAKRTCIKKGDHLEKEEMNAIVEQLFACPTPSYAPDGRKTIVMMNLNEIEALFV
ncbi:DNA mismatch repair endonuclease MutL [Sediminitomix flava]|uniref:DNA mismatch repair protein MutL n=1 Tax=Sediminitomix flava TaxID=379075 RepID=A0A315Z170_SEDFL|nr:DNA mismatch repair endonuclease MutL [Sediminitomix flava]PWJ36055.1 DNA mismatch repair protein MutL [Sediminitomix flava]